VIIQNVIYQLCWTVVILKLNGVKISCWQRRHFYNKSYFLIWTYTVLLVWLFYLQCFCSLYEVLAWWWTQVFSRNVSVPVRLLQWCTSTNVNYLLYVELWQRSQMDDLCSGVRFSHASGIMFSTVSIPTVRFTKHLGDLSVLQCPCLLWDSPNLLEICLLCTVHMPTVRLTEPLGDLSVLHSAHVYCETHQTFWRSVCSAQCTCLLWDSPNLLEICLVHSVHAYCETHQTSRRAACFAQCTCLLWDSPNS
jgi:hypothetical protein